MLSLHRRKSLRRTLYHLHNRETYPYSSKDNFDRCPVIRSWIILVPLDWLMARHTSGAVHIIAYYRAYVWSIGDDLRPFSLFCRGRALTLNFIPYNSGKNSFFDWSILNTFKIMWRYVLIWKYHLAFLIYPHRSWCSMFKQLIPGFLLKNTFQITLYAFQKFYIISDQQYVNNIYSSEIL